jgi:hypothetical protein
MACDLYPQPTRFNDYARVSRVSGVAWSIMLERALLNKTVLKIYGRWLYRINTENEWLKCKHITQGAGQRSALLNRCRFQSHEGYQV